MLCVGKEARLPGQASGAGLTSEAADALGLKAGLPVAVSSLDAHAGALGNWKASLNFPPTPLYKELENQLVGCYLFTVSDSPLLLAMVAASHHRTRIHS